jgi:sortase (surface protein transpeptidase)
MWASVPTRLVIPAVEVDTDLIPLGLGADGTLDVPAAGFPAGWYTGAPTPGELGPAVIAGHIDWNGPGVFFAISHLVPGDAVLVTREDGSVATFAVVEVAEFGKEDFPTALVYGGIDFAGLRLITCGGVFNRKAGHYEDNIVVFASLVSSTPPTPVPTPVASPVLTSRPARGASLP